MKCPICNQTNLRKIKSSVSNGINFSVFQCQNEQCFHGFIDPIPSAKFLERFYSGDKLNDYMMDDKCIKDYTDHFNHLLSNYINSYVKPGKLLDIGAGTGIFMNAARNNGWLVDGIDFNRSSTEYAKDKFDLFIHRGDMYNLESFFIKGSYDLIIMNHVLEHVIDPVEYLKYIRSYLKQAGLILVTVPNILSDDFKKEGSEWSYLHIPGHISYFSRHSLDNVFNESGFKKLFESTFPGHDQKEGEGLTALYELL